VFTYFCSDWASWNSFPNEHSSHKPETSRAIYKLCPEHFSGLEEAREQQRRKEKERERNETKQRLIIRDVDHKYVSKGVECNTFYPKISDSSRGLLGCGAVQCFSKIPTIQRSMMSGDGSNMEDWGCSVMVGHQRFKGPCCPHLKSKDGGSMDLWIDGFLPQHYAASQHRRTRPEVYSSLAGQDVREHFLTWL